MREEAFRAFLTGRLGARSVGSYLSDCRKVERLLAVDLDGADLSEPAIEQLLRGLASAGTADKSISNCRSALRSYALFKR